MCHLPVSLAKVMSVPPNAAYQPRRALRAAGCMRLFGTRWKSREDPGVVSLDHLVRPRQHRWRNRQAEGLGDLEVDDQLKRGRLLDGQVGGLGALEDLVDEDGRAPPDLAEVHAIGDQPAGLDIQPEWVHGGETTLCRQLLGL